MRYSSRDGHTGTTCVWQELDYRVDTCRVTKGGRIEHLQGRTETWSVSPSVDMLPFGVTIPATVPHRSKIPEGCPGYCTAEVGNPGGTCELSCIYRDKLRGPRCGHPRSVSSFTAMCPPLSQARCCNYAPHFSTFAK